MDKLRYTEEEIRSAVRITLQNMDWENVLFGSAESGEEPGIALRGDLGGTPDLSVIEEKIISLLREGSAAGSTDSLSEGFGCASIGFWSTLSASLSAAQKSEIVQKLFPGYSSEEIREAVIMLRCFYDNGMSLAQTSEMLHMHKNTLNYRLNRLTRTTGLNPRSGEGAARYQMCVHLLEFSPLG